MSSEHEKELLDLFNEAETWIKKIEVQYEGEYFAPSSNELRYAFGHYLKFQANNNENEYSKSKNHILRAIYDAKEFILITFLEKIKDFEKEYKTVSISDAIPNWVEHRRNLNKIKKILSEDKTLKQNISKFNEVYDNLKEIKETTDAAISELDKIRRNDFLNKFIPIFIGIIGVVSGIVIAILK